MVLTNSDEYCEELRLLRFHGSGGGYIYKRIGYCSRLDELQAAALLVKMKRIREWTETRRKNARFYFEALKNVSSVVLPTVAPGNQHVFHQFTLRVPGEGRRDALQEYLKVHDVGCAVFYPLSLHLQGPYAKFGYHTGDFPHSERVTEEVLSIPIHPHLGLEQLKYVAETIAAFK
jgi:dTDP-4-amino-4,6-dideoxygalactose transaminase